MDKNLQLSQVPIATTRVAPMRVPTKEEKSNDGLVILCNGKISSKQFEELKSLNCLVNDELLKQKFYEGKLRIGRSQNSLYWEECSKIFSETPKKIENIQKEIKQNKLTLKAKRERRNK